MAPPSNSLDPPVNVELKICNSFPLKIVPPYPFAVLSSKVELITSKVPSL